MSTIQAKRYSQLLSPAGFGRPIYAPNYVDGPYLRLGDVWIESGNGRDLDRLMNAFVDRNHHLNTYKSPCKIPSSFEPLPINESGILWSRCPGPIRCGTQGSKGGISITFCPAMSVEANGSVSVDKTKNPGALLIFQPYDAVAVDIVNRTEYKAWIMENLELLITRGKGIYSYSKAEVMTHLRFPYRVVHAKKWAWAFWDHLDEDLHFEVSAGAEDVVQTECRWGTFSAAETAHTRVGPSNFRPYATGSENRPRFLHNASQHSEMKENEESSTPKDLTSSTLQENSSYPYEPLFANPQAILYHCFKLKDDKSLREVLAAPFRCHTKKKGRWFKKGNDDDNDNAEKGRKDKNKDVEEGRKDGDDDDKDNSGSGSDGYSYHIGHEVDASDDYDDILLTYLLMHSPKDVHVAMLDTAETEAVYRFAQAVGCSITAALKAFNPEVAVESGSKFKVASFAFGTLGVLRQYLETIEDGEDVEGTEDGNSDDEGSSGSVGDKSDDNNHGSDGCSHRIGHTITDCDDILHSYLLMHSPEDVHVAMLDTTETEAVYNFAQAAGCSITAALKALNPAVVVSGSNYKVAHFADGALDVFTRESNWESLGSTNDSESEGRGD